MHDNDERWMERAIELAEKGRYTAHPNPRVGCVIVKDGKLIGAGWHEAPGEPHAEQMALQEAGAQAEGATCYVNLEPCTHHGRTPPCTEALIHARVGRVVVAHEDPNPKAAGGCKLLAEHGIDVTVGPLRQHARKLNRGFIKRHERGMPFTVGKMAISADGRTAMPDGQSRWITSEPARQHVHQLRAQSGAVVTGIGTVLKDDPRLDARLAKVKGLPPLRVILDPHGRLDNNAQVINPPGEVLQFTGTETDAYSRANRSVVKVPLVNNRLDLKACWRHLANLEINDIFLECGPTLLGAALDQELVDELVLYIAPKLFGHGARPLAYLPGIECMEDQHELIWTSVRKVGPDIELIADVKARRG